MGADRAAAVDAIDRVPRRSRSSCAAARILAGSSPLSRPAASSTRTACESIGWFLEIGPVRANSYGRGDRSAEYCRGDLAS